MSLWSIVIGGVLVLCLGVLVVFRRVGGWYNVEAAEVKPESAKASNYVSRRAEAVILLAAATAVFVFTATNTSTGGRLLVLDQLKFGFAVVNAAVAFGVILVVLLGVLITYRKGWTSMGTIIATMALCAYGMLLNRPEHLLESLAPEDSTVPPATLTFAMYGTDAEGAELWINDVKLGTLPCEMTFGEFYEKVPYWAEEPNEMKLENRDAWLVIPDYSWPGPGGGSNKMPWARIPLPGEPAHRDERESSARRKSEKRDFYARVKLGEEWGYSTGGAGRSGGGGGRDGRRQTKVSFGFIFPERQKRIEKLLDIARAHDYQPGGEWFETIETYNSDGWIAVRKAMDTEPEMLKLLDTWARWRYGLDEVNDAKSAWLKFEQICDEADTRQFYRTSDVMGRAVELVVPELEPERLVKRAMELIRRITMLSWLTWEMNGRVQFGYTEVPDGMHTGASGHTWRAMGGGGRGLPISGYAVAHAIWRLHELLQEEDSVGPNIVQEEVVPTAVRWHSHNMSLLRIACHFGGPQLERYLLRQNWRADPKGLPWREKIDFVGNEVNAWLYHLAHLRSPGGREFREEHAEAIFDMTDAICEAEVRDRGDMEEELDFLFHDLDCGDRSLAYKYWPRFCEHARTYVHVRDPLRIQLEYLRKMEPVSTVEMYVEAWRETETDSGDYTSALRVLDELPYEKRRAIAEALVKDVGAKGPAKFDGMSGEELVRKIRPYLERGNEDERQVRRILERMDKRNGYTRDEIRTWLSEGKPWHPLVGMLAEESDPGLRVLVMGALVSHPTPENREILSRLLNDPDEGVREAAAEARAKIEQLKNMPPKELAHAGRR